MNNLPKKSLLYNSVIRNGVFFVLILSMFSALQRFGDCVYMHRYEINLNYFPKSMLVNKIDDIYENSLIFSRKKIKSMHSIEENHLYDVIGYSKYLSKHLKFVIHEKTDSGHLVQNWWLSYSLYYAFLWCILLIFGAMLLAKLIVFFNFDSVYVLRLLGADVSYTKRYLKQLFSGFLVHTLVFLLHSSLFLLYSSALKICDIWLIIAFISSILIFYLIYFIVITLSLKKL